VEVVFGKIVFGLVGISGGMALIVYARYIVENITGPIAPAERYLGGAGTYSFFRILGMIMIISSVLVLFGINSVIYDSIMESLGGVAGK
jgi:hypothetical protein